MYKFILNLKFVFDSYQPIKAVLVKIGQNLQIVQNRCNTKNFKKLGFLTILVISIGFISACEVNAKDKIAPKLVSTNIENNKPISSFARVVLVFSETLDKTKITNNIILKYANSKPVEKEKYFIEYDNIRKISIGFLDSTLKNTSAKYFLEIGQLQDLAGNKLENSKTIEINFKDDIAPELVTKNTKIADYIADNVLTIEFNEDIDPNSVKKGETFCATTYEYNYRCEKDISDHKYAKNTLLDQSKYELKVEKNKIIVTLDKDYLKIGSETQKYIFFLGVQVGQGQDISVNGVKDLAGNSLYQRFRPQRIVATFYEKIPPSFIGSNLPTNNNFDTKNTLILKFSELLLLNSIKSENFVLKQGSQIIDSSKYKIFYDANINIYKGSDEVFFKIIDEKLQNSNKKYTLEFQNLVDKAGNKSLLASQEIKFVDSINPKFENTSIFDEKVLTGTKQIAMAFSEELTATNLDIIQVQKNSVNLSTNEFSTKLSADEKSIILEFVNDLDASATYQIDIPNSIQDKSGNGLQKALNFNFRVLDKNKVLYAKSDGKADADGLTWQNALSLQAGIDKVSQDSSKEFLLVASGTYKHKQEDQTFELKDGVKIYGGFSENPNEARNLTGSIIDGQISETLKSQQLINGENLSANTLLDGFLLQNAKNIQEKHKGGAIYLKNSSPIFRNLTFTKNTSYGEKIVRWKDGINGQKLHLLSRDEENGSGGGAIYIASDATTGTASNPTIENCKFISNNTSYFGGAIFIAKGSQAKIINSYFQENYATEKGGAIYDIGGKNSTLSIENSVFNKNLSHSCYPEDEKKQRCVMADADPGFVFGVGGAISAIGSKISISDSSFTDNYTAKATYTYAKSGGGGALHLIETDLNINKSLFKNNMSIFGGAIYNLESPKTLIANTSFIANKVTIEGTANGMGGAIHNRKSSPTIINSTFVDNVAIFGGAIYNTLNSKPKIYNSILWNNKQGLFRNYINGHNYPKNPTLDNVFSTINSEVEFQNSIVNPLSIKEDNLYMSIDASKDNKTQDPKFKPYLSSDTFIQLDSTSPAKNAGSDALYTSTISGVDLTREKDQIGRNRKQGTNLDLGAIETEN